MNRLKMKQFKGNILERFIVYGIKFYLKILQSIQRCTPKPGQMYMKSTLKGLLLFGISIAAGACFDPPDFSAIPHIDFENIYFQQAKAPADRDALVLTISFHDGDGDLGLSATEIDPPYHDMNFYLANNGQLVQLQKRTLAPEVPQVLEVPPNASGKLAIVRTSRDAAYKNVIPTFIDIHESCKDFIYSNTLVYVREQDKHIFDETYQTKLEDFPISEKIYSVIDTFYYTRNPNYANIDVEFWVKDGAEFKLFDWEKEFCTIAFNQRFHVLSDSERPLQGSLEYTMATSGLKTIFGVKTLKLKIRIRDRSLNVSNEIETPEFTLN
jgi:hypothetical protein